MRRWMEAGLALGGVILLGLAARAWYDVPFITPITLGYLLEAVALGVGVLWTVIVDENRLRWACLGALSALTLLGMWSIGGSLLPGLLIAGAASVLAAVRTRARPMPAVGWFLVGGVAQTLLMVAVLWTGTRAVPIEGNIPAWPPGG